MTCPRCKTHFDGDSLVCSACHMAWPSHEFVTPSAEKYQLTAARWKNWTLEKRRISDRDDRGG